LIYFGVVDVELLPEVGLSEVADESTPLLLFAPELPPEALASVVSLELEVPDPETPLPAAPLEPTGLSADGTEPLAMLWRIHARMIRISAGVKEVRLWLEPYSPAAGPPSADSALCNAPLNLLVEVEPLLAPTDTSVGWPDFAGLPERSRASETGGL
jgi:hypothetical protein